MRPPLFAVVWHFAGRTAIQSLLRVPLHSRPTIADISVHRLAIVVAPECVRSVGRAALGKNLGALPPLLMALGHRIHRATSNIVRGGSLSLRAHSHQPSQPIIAKVNQEKR